MQRAAELERLGDNAGANAQLTKAYAHTGNTEILLDRTRVRRALGDSVGACADLRECGRLGELWSTRYQGECVRKDSVEFAASGLSAARFPGMKRVRRVRHVDEADLYLGLVDAGDTVRVGLVVSGNDTLFTKTEELPAYPGGMSEMYKHMAQTMRYPDDCADMGIQGKVFVQFTVAPDGRISDARVKRSVHPSLDAEALRVVNAMPPWTPARYRGEAVPFRFVLPVKFTLR
ncbi:MAG: energy transducer TonB [Flavobacteriales bacterium]|nr:energy transducer TonB [Flavobacteriales bacterium]